jgi:hypothetical protein
MMLRVLLLVVLVGLVGCSEPPAGAGTSTPAAKPAVSPVASPGGPGVPSPVAQASVVAPTEVVEVTVPDLTIGDILDGGGGPRNVVQAINNKDNRFEARGHVEVNRIRRERVDPVNIANARSSCTDCQSIAVAIQINVYRRGASTVAPQNAAFALNENCTRCVTVARAIQYVIPVDDPRELPRRADELARAMNREMHYFESIHDIDKLDPKKAEQRLQNLQNEFSDLLQYVQEARDEKVEENSPTPSPSPSPSETATLVPVPGPTGTGTAAPAPGGVVTPSPVSTP